MEGLLHKTREAILDVLFPARCVGCGREGRYMCVRCEGFVSEASLICPVCRDASFTGECHADCKKAYSLDGLVSVWEYEGVMKNLLRAITYSGVTHAIRETTERACQVMARDEERFQDFLSFLVAERTTVTYVPLHGTRERYRGFNQAALFAQALASMAGKEVVSTLGKAIETKPQADLAAQEHRNNVRNTFFTKEGLPKDVVLVDDFWVTGATMEECCRMLKRSGVERVWGYTIARTP